MLHPTVTSWLGVLPESMPTLAPGNVWSRLGGHNAPTRDPIVREARGPRGVPQNI